MAKFNLSTFFLLKSITPSALVQDNLITFSYKSPVGVHDKNPLVFVLEKRLDRIFGLNLHYDMNDFQDIIEETTEKINNFLETEWYKKFPEKKKELKESKEEFSREMIDEKLIKEFERRIPKRDLETFFYSPKNDSILRTYLYKRMTKVSKLTFKV